MYDKVEHNGELGFWDYIHIAFRTLLTPKKLVPVGPARGTLYALPNGKTFVKVSPRLQEVRPPTTDGPLPMPNGSVIPGSVPGVDSFLPCTSASFELDDQFEAEIRARDVRELAEAQPGYGRGPELTASIEKTALDLVEARDEDNLIKETR